MYLIQKMGQAKPFVPLSEYYIYTEIFLAMANPALTVSTRIVLYFFIMALVNREG